LFYGNDQIGFECFANYVPFRKVDRMCGKRMKMHSNRAVIHPDYVGLGLGLRMIDVCSEIMWQRGYDIYAKFSAVPLFKARQKSLAWDYLGTVRHHKIVVGGNMTREAGFRIDVAAHQFHYVPEEYRGENRTESETDCA
jgi:hypothetical protein